MKYILYARKSTEEDDRQILSIEAQLVELQEYATKEKLACPSVAESEGGKLSLPFRKPKPPKNPGELNSQKCWQFLNQEKQTG